MCCICVRPGAAPQRGTQCNTPMAGTCHYYPLIAGDLNSDTGTMFYDGIIHSHSCPCLLSGGMPCHLMHRPFLYGNHNRYVCFALQHLWFACSLAGYVACLPRCLPWYSRGCTWEQMWLAVSSPSMVVTRMHSRRCICLSVPLPCYPRQGVFDSLLALYHALTSTEAECNCSIWPCI
jgi:hypothetical protein